MAGTFKKILCVSSTSSTCKTEDVQIDRFSWTEIGQIKNFSDYDFVYINLNALSDHKQVPFNLEHVAGVFKATYWAHILHAKGTIFIIGHPVPQLLAINPERYEVEPQRIAPLSVLLTVNLDLRSPDYRRVIKTDDEEFKMFFEYFKTVRKLDYSIQQVFPTGLLSEQLGGYSVQYIGGTTYDTHLAAKLEYKVLRGNPVSNPGSIILLPPSGNGTENEDTFLLRNWLKLPIALPPPQWVSRLRLPAEPEIIELIAERQKTAIAIQAEIEAEEKRLETCRRWYRLLYKDGEELEAIVKEAFEKLDAKVRKVSVEKDDYRMVVAGFPEEVVMEVKGTHNRKFGKGPLR